MFKPKTNIPGSLENSSVERIQTTDLWVMSKDPESVPFVQRDLQNSQTNESWFLLARHAAVVDRCAHSRPFTCVRKVLFLQTIVFFSALGTRFKIDKRSKLITNFFTFI